MGSVLCHQSVPMGSWMRQVRSTHLGEHGSKLCFQLLHFRQSLNEKAWGGEEPNGVSSRSSVKNNHREVKMMDNPEKGSAIQDSIELLSCCLQHIHECMHTQYPSISTKPFASSIPGMESENSARSSLAIPDSPPGGKGKEGERRWERGEGRWGRGKRQREREERGGEEKKQ